MIKFRVNGTPAPQGSKRHVGGGRMVEMSKAVGSWREAVRAEAQHQLALDPARLKAWWLVGSYNAGPGPIMRPPEPRGLSVTVVFVLKRPAGHYRTGRNAHLLRDAAPRFPAGRPDVDKLARAVLDGLVMGGVMADDSQVVSLVARKTYAQNGEAPGAIIEVEAMGG